MGRTEISHHSPVLALMLSHCDLITPGLCWNGSHSGVFGMFFFVDTGGVALGNGAHPVQGLVE